MSVRYYRKVIKIRAEDSPNVRRELMRRRGDPEALWPPEVPGVLPWSDYDKRRQTWDKIRQCVGLDAEFYEGAEVMLFPREWLARAAQVAEQLRGTKRVAEAVGIDPGEGGANTSMAAVDRLGLIELVGKKTPDTSVVTSEAIAFGRRHGVPPEKWIFDRGGGGKEHADRLRSQGFPVQTVAFGEAPSIDPRYGMVLVRERMETKEDRYAYVNRRAEMYGDVRQMIDPTGGLPDGTGRIIGGPSGWGIPAEYTPLREQMTPIPLKYDPEGRLKLPSKNKKSEDSKEKTLVELIGYSPDELDALVLAVHGMLNKVMVVKAGAF